MCAGAKELRSMHAWALWLLEGVWSWGASHSRSCSQPVHAPFSHPLWVLRVEDLDGVQAARHLHERRVQEVALELLRLQRGAHDDQLQV